MCLLRHGAGKLAKENSRAGERGGIGITVRSVDGVRRDGFFKPLQQRLGLRIVNKTSPSIFHPDRNGPVRQRLYRIAHFKVVLASAREPGELPCRNAINKDRKSTRLNSSHV